MSRPSIDRSLLSGSFYTSLSEGAAMVAGLVTSLVAARVLSPRDFGLMAAATLALSILNHISQSGFDNALIQKQKDFEAYLDVAWTWQLLRGLTISFCLILAAYPISQFYGEPILFPIVALSCLSSGIRGGTNVGRIFFSRKLDFRTLFFVNAAQAVLRIAVFLPAVLILQNVWALVVGHLARAALAVVISFVAHPYRPKLSWDRPKLQELLGYGKWITGLAWIGFIITQGDDLFVSKYIGIAALGVYQFAYEISNLPTTRITHVIGRIGFPTYSRLVEDKEALRDTFLKCMRVTLLLSGPVTVLIFVVIPDITYVVGEQWAPAIPLVRIMVMAGFVRSIVALMGPMFQAVGRPDMDFKMNLPRFAATLLLIWPFCAAFGLEGACWVILIAVSTCLPTWYWGVRTFVNVDFATLIRTNALAGIATVAVGLCLVGARELAPATPTGAVVALVGGLGAWLMLDTAIGAFTSFGVVREIRSLLRFISDARKDGKKGKEGSMEA